ncbi:CAP domain-containing protein [Nonomuraea soli]|uniref:Uncharacterized protein YkwD n=1 Tax=Nonomuraea soli TaxID=1032476 RepID=A0A7W0CPZ0_9ACTN|nr:CAP domain-containing protein [Nonomuraea soli]MBA2895198.1 uncharacterized protein YkwD [Nonomuraea soli]
MTERTPPPSPRTNTLPSTQPSDGLGGAARIADTDGDARVARSSGAHATRSSGHAPRAHPAITSPAGVADAARDNGTAATSAGAPTTPRPPRAAGAHIPQPSHTDAPDPSNGDASPPGSANGPHPSHANAADPSNGNASRPGYANDPHPGYANDPHPGYANDPHHHRAHAPRPTHPQSLHPTRPHTLNPTRPRTLHPTSPSTTARRLALALTPIAILLTTALATATPAAAAATTNCSLGNPRTQILAQFHDSTERELERLINDFRQENGLTPLVASSTALSRAAQWASNDSAAMGVSPSNHVDSLGRNITTRFTQCGVSGFTKFAEINYYGWGGSVPPSQALQWWMQSPGHRAVLVDPAWKSFGIGRAIKGDKVHWTVTFGDKVLPKRLGKVKLG